MFVAAADVTQVMKCRPGGPTCCMYPDTDEGKGTLYLLPKKTTAVINASRFPRVRYIYIPVSPLLPHFPTILRPIHISPNAAGYRCVHREICRYLTRKDESVTSQHQKGVVAWHGRQKYSSSGNKMKEYPKWKIGPYDILTHSLTQQYVQRHI